MRHIFRKGINLCTLILSIICFSSCGSFWTLGAKFSTDINDYGIGFEKYLINEELLVIFPENLNNIKHVNEYIFKYDKISYAGNQIFLDVTYDETTFKKEVAYWAEFEYLHKNDKYEFEYIKLKLDDTCSFFNYTTYVALYNWWGDYSYISLIPEENRIIYVTMKDVWEGEECIPKEFLPKNYSSNLYNEEEKWRFSINGDIEDHCWPQ